MIEAVNRTEPDYFVLFDMAPDWNLDTGQLHDRYLELQRHHHPDNFAAVDSAERRRAAEIALNLTEAHDVLMDAVARAGHLLRRAGVNLVDESTIALSVGFLSAQLELREQVAGVAGSVDEPEQLQHLGGARQQRV